MPRGEMLKTKLKREILATVPLGIALKEAERKIEQRKPLKQSVEEHIGKFIDRVTADDVVKIVAWLGLAYMIKPVLDGNEEIAERVKYVRAIRKLNAPLGTTGSGLFGASWIEVIDSVFGGKVPPEQVEKIKADVQAEGIEHWALALATSALIVVFGPSLLEGFGGMVSKLALGLLA